MPEPSLWITYAWVDDKGGDFSALVQELRTVGIRAKYDRVTLIPGQRLWQQIADNIMSSDLSGWASLITPASLLSEPCREELAYALDRALRAKGEAFPLIGLLQSGVRIEDVPLSLRSRLCVNLASPNWKEQVKAALERRPPVPDLAPRSKYAWRFHPGFQGNAGAVVVEIGPRFGEITYWRFAVPAESNVLAWGHGPAGRGAPAGGLQREVIEGTASIEGKPVKWFGSGDNLSPFTSAYVALEYTAPIRVGFGVSDSTYAAPSQWEMMTVARA